jgi:chemotaxis protein CheD
MSTSHLYDEALAPNFYFDRHFDIDAVKILPGEYYATARPMLIVTVLGSCVAACIRDRVSGIGGMNHFMLPFNNEAVEPGGASACYGIHAMEILIDQLLNMGARRRNLEAKIFGGGNLIKGFTVDNVGERNAVFVRDYLKLEQIPIVAEDLLDIYPRKIYFLPEQDKVMVKKLKRLHNCTIIQREQNLSNRLCSETFTGGDRDLF